MLICYIQGMAPQPEDVIVTGRRLGAFTGTDMDYVVRAKGISNLVLTGVATSRVVLSTCGRPPTPTTT